MTSVLTRLLGVPALALIAGAGMAAANTMTFDGLSDEGAQATSYAENGITATALGGVLAYLSAPGAAHLDDSGTAMGYGLDFTMAGTFDAAGFSLTSLGYNFWDIPDPLSDNIFVTGFLGGNTVASASYTLSGIAGTVQSIILGAAFSGLDRLRIELLYPVNSALCDAPCGHLDLDSVTLTPAGIAPVPLPPAGALLAGAGIALAALRRRRRR